MNEKMELADEPFDNPNTVGTLFLVPAKAVNAPNTIGKLLVGALEAVDAPNENPVDGDVEFNVETNAADLAGCQLVPNKLGVVPLLEQMELVSDKEAEEPSPVDLIVNSLAAVEPGMELPEARVVVPANPKDGEEVEEPNRRDIL